jgi:hypothetical protein
MIPVSFRNEDEKMQDKNQTPRSPRESQTDDPVRDIKGVEEALDDMVTHEQRRDQDYRTGGDDHSPGVDIDPDSNAPKYSEDRRS